MSATDAKKHASLTSLTSTQTTGSRRALEAAHLSMLKALVEAAEDIESGRAYAWDDFKPRLAHLRAKAKRIAP